MRNCRFIGVKHTGLRLHDKHVAEQRFEFGQLVPKSSRHLECFPRPVRKVPECPEGIRQKVQIPGALPMPLDLVLWSDCVSGSTLKSTITICCPGLSTVPMMAAFRVYFWL